MVSAPTVMIVGAGGSIPYGFPSGRSLKDEIVTNLPHDGNLLGSTMNHLDYSKQERAHFASELRSSGRVSIDAFLEDRSEFTDIGKDAIASALVPREVPDNLYKCPPADDWYSYLFNQLTDNLKQRAGSRLTIITFNYDRSLDQFLYSCFSHSYNLNGADLRPKLTLLRIVHLHGSLGQLPLYREADGPVRTYTSSVTPEAISTAARSIRIVNEADDSDPEFKAARDALREAERICAIGFGYGFTNVQRLLIGDWISAKNVIPSVYGSAYDLTAAERERIWNQFQTRIQLDQSGFGCCRYLREHVQLIA